MTMPDPKPAPAVKERSRRAILAGALTGVGAWAASAFARTSPVAAAAGDPIRMGQTNTAGGTNTILQTNTSGQAYKVVQLGSGTALRGESSGGNGAYIHTTSANKFGLLARNASTNGGSGAAIRANGGKNIGTLAPSRSTSRPTSAGPT
jgi:hypothetical protein